MILLILILFFQSTSVDIYAVQNETYFARVLFDQVYFYKTPTEDNYNDNILFELPKTYFVELTNINGDFYEAKYLNFKGYVKKDSVQAVSGTPQNPFLTDIYFRVYAEMSESLWSSPSTTNSNLITKIPHLTNKIQYFGKISGETLISGRTNYWYYCKFSNNQDEYYGYVYSDFCDEMSEIKNNTEILNHINNPTFQKPVEPIKTIPKTSNVVGIIVGILSIPALIFVFLVVKGTKIFNQDKTKRKEIVDY